MTDFTAFLAAHPPGPAVRPCTEAQLAPYRGQVAEVLLDFWQQVGWGSFSDGLLHFFDPADYAHILAEWLGGAQPGRVPVARTAFNDLFYYRDKGPHVVDEDAGLTVRIEDMNLVDVHYKTIHNCTWDVAEFFHNYLCDPRVIETELRAPLYAAVRPRLGTPGPDEGYYFVPWLALGGPGTADTVQRGGARETLSLLVQL